MSKTRVIMPVDEQRVREIFREELAALRPTKSEFIRATCVNGAPKWACDMYCGCLARRDA